MIVAKFINIYTSGEYIEVTHERFSYLTIRLSKAINIVASTLRAYYMWGVIF